MEPFLKWAGGKSFLAPVIREMYQHSGSEVICEPFCGAGSIFLEVQANRSILSDNNEHLINCYNQIKTSGLDITLDTTNTRENFLSVRQKFNDMISTGAQYSEFCAQAFYFMNRTCFRGLCRFAKIKGNFNVGWGKYKKPIVLPTLSSYQAFFQSCTFISGDFTQSLRLVTRETFVFIDPPYFNTFTGYCQGGFSLDDQERLARAVGKLNNPIIATNSFEDEILKLYQDQGFTTFKYYAPRKISSDGNRDKAPEMIAVKNVCLKQFRAAMRRSGQKIQIIHPKSIEKRASKQVIAA